jgi:hypothetical protein
MDQGGQRRDQVDATQRPALTLADFESNYAASRDDADKVAEVLGRFGLKVDSISLPTRSMRVSGTVAAMEAAFHPNLGIYESADQGEFRDRQDDYQVPAELKGIVTAVLGFGQRRVARRMSVAAATKTAHSIAPLGPADIEKHYSFPREKLRVRKLRSPSSAVAIFPQRQLFALAGLSRGIANSPGLSPGHGTVAGACITVLKFFLDRGQTINNPVVPSCDGFTLEPYVGPGHLTVNGELHKLAHNISFGHGIHAGIHWRGDTDYSLLLGEAVAISFLEDQMWTYEERFDITITKMDGTPHHFKNF